MAKKPKMASGGEAKKPVQRKTDNLGWAKKGILGKGVQNRMGRAEEMRKEAEKSRAKKPGMKKGGCVRKK